VYDKLLLLQSAGIVCVCAPASFTQPKEKQQKPFVLMARKIKKRNKKMKIFFKKTLQLGETLSLSLLILYFVFIFSYLLFARQCRRIRRRRRRQTQFITGDSVIIYKVS
jgi:hypothetical protein